MERNGMTMEELIIQLKKDIIEALSLEDIVPEDFDADTPLFVEGLGLDSIDALELILLMERKYQVKITDPKDRRVVLRNVRAMAECIQHNQTLSH
jgi:acyl carrier protein